MRLRRGSKGGDTVDDSGRYRDDSISFVPSSRTLDQDKSKEWASVAEQAVSPVTETLPSIPQWNFRVDGRKFSRYLEISKRRPRRSIFFLPTMEPTHKFATVWGHTNTITDMTYTSFIVPLSLAFNGLYSMNFWTILDIIGSSIYLVDLFLEFHIGFMVRWDMETVTIIDGIEIAKRYVTKGSFVIDFLACAPIFIQLGLALSSSAESNRSVAQLLMLLRLLRLLRVVNLIMRMGQVATGGSMSYQLASRFSTLALFVFRIGFTMAVLVNLMACIWWWVAVTEGLNNSWVATFVTSKPMIDLYTSSNLTRWIVCAYYVLCTISTIGYGDITPMTTAEVCVAILFILIGVAYFGYVVSNIGTLLSMMKASGSGDDILKKFRGMENWMKRSGFHANVRQEIRRFYYSMWSPALDEDYSAYFDELPLWLRTKAIRSVLEGSEALKAFTDIDPTADSVIDKNIIKAVSATAIPFHIRGSQKLFQEGDDADYVYLMEEGEIGAVIAGDRMPYRISSPGIIGSAAVFRKKIPECSTRLMTVFTITSCTFWRVDADDLWNRLLATAPVTLLTMLDKFAASVNELAEHIEIRTKEADILIDKDKFLKSNTFILQKIGELRKYIAEASEHRLMRDIEKGKLEEDGPEHMHLKHLIYPEMYKQKEEKKTDEDDTREPVDGPTSEDLAKGRPFMPLIRKQRALFDNTDDVAEEETKKTNILS